MKLTKKQVIEAIAGAVLDIDINDEPRPLPVNHTPSKVVEYDVEIEGPYGNMFYLLINDQEFTVTVSQKRSAESGE